MKKTSQDSLFVELTAEESATVNGAYYYHNPCAFNPVYYDGYQAGYGMGYGYGQASSTTQTTNVNITIED
ncbi:MAG: hypothetical protein WBD58_12520 [Geitlerinemataceae cyanobacterium]